MNFPFWFGLGFFTYNLAFECSSKPFGLRQVGLKVNFIHRLLTQEVSTQNCQWCCCLFLHLCFVTRISLQIYLCFLFYFGVIWLVTTFFLISGMEFKMNFKFHLKERDTKCYIFSQTSENLSWGSAWSTGRKLCEGKACAFPRQIIFIFSVSWKLRLT